MSQNQTKPQNQNADCPTNDKMLPYSYFYRNACIYAHHHQFDVLQLLEMIIRKIESTRKILYNMSLMIEFHPSLRGIYREADTMLEEATAYAYVAAKKLALKSGEGGGEKQTC